MPAFNECELPQCHVADTVFKLKVAAILIAAQDLAFSTRQRKRLGNCTDGRFCIVASQRVARYWLDVVRRTGRIEDSVTVTSNMQRVP